LFVYIIYISLYYLFETC